MKAQKGNPFTQRDTEKDGDPDIQDAKAGNSDESEEEAIARKSGTRPWEPKGGSNAPWSPDLLRIGKEKEGMHLRWVREDNVDRKMQEGYQLANGDAYGIKPNAEGRIQRRELVLMEIPQEYVEMRENNKEALARRIQQDSRRGVDDAARKAGVKVTEEE